MKKIGLIFMLVFIITSCTKEVIIQTETEDKQIIETETIQIPEIKDQPNF